MLKAIVAVANQGVIGRDNQMPWHLTEDLQRFKQLTLGAQIIMGRKTFESILNALGKPLPGRTSLVLTRETAAFEARHAQWIQAGQVRVLSTWDQVLRTANAMGGTSFVAGGAQIYAQALPVCEAVHLTQIDLEVPGDAWFPALSESEWSESAGPWLTSQSGLRYRFIDYQRKKTPVAASH